jgi:hypothetical protein
MKKIFIGSSSEGKHILEKVEKMLENEYEIIRWDKSMTTNRSTLDCLIENAIKVDEAIFIGTADNIAIATNDNRAEKEGAIIKHRDNVVFEFGLFLGMLGRHDCVYLVDDSTLKNIMTDYNGINVITFDKNRLDSSLPVAVERIKDSFNKYSSRDINLFPSTSMAAAYFKNFIQPIFTHYSINKGTIISNDNKKYKNCCINIVLPRIITDDVNMQFDEIKRNKQITTATVDINCLGRSRTLLIDAQTSDFDISIIDFPTIISGIYHAVHALLPDEDKKTNPDYQAIMERELERFAETLSKYVNEISCKSLPIKILKEDELLVDIPKRNNRKRIYWFFRS